MSELGKKLKDRRESLGLSLSEASLSTKIGARMIAAIEEGDFKVLPALPFAKGFVRSYSSYLKLDGDEMVALYLSEIGETPEERVEDSTEKEASSQSAPPVHVDDDSGGLSKFIIMGAVVLLIGAIVGVKSLVDKYQKEADVSGQEAVVVDPIEKEESLEPVEEKVVVTAEKPDVAPPSTPEEKPVEEKKPVEKKVEELKVEEKKETKAEVVAAPAPAPALEEKKEEPVEDAKKQVEVLLEALDRVQVSLSYGDNKQKVSLNAGEVHILRTGDAVQLDISDGGAVNLIVNGRSRGVPGSLGQRKKVTVP